MRVIIEPGDSAEKIMLARAWEANKLVVIELESTVPAETSVDDRFRKAVMALQDEGLIKHKYDFTWLYAAIQKGLADGIVEFVSVKSFITFVANLGIQGIAANSTLAQYYAYVQGKFPDWTFSDTRNVIEKSRRINLVKRFLKLFNAS
jgi:hypothetical protein